jgi:hypothetical protein
VFAEQAHEEGCKYQHRTNISKNCSNCAPTHALVPEHRLALWICTGRGASFSGRVVLATWAPNNQNLESHTNDSESTYVVYAREFLHACEYTQMHTHAGRQTNTHIHTHIQIHPRPITATRPQHHIHPFAYVGTCMHVVMWSVAVFGRWCICTCMYNCVFVCVLTFACICVCVCMCFSVYVHGFVCVLTGMRSSVVGIV